MQHCCLDTVSNAFTSLLSLFNNVQRNSESTIKYCPCFNGLTLELAHCKVVIPSILLVMLFLCARHDWYEEIVNQFWTCFKPIETATLDSIVSKKTYHNCFQVMVHSKKGKLGSGSGPRVPAAASANTNANCHGKVWQSPFEWLAQYGIKGIEGHWMRAMAGTGICPICHCKELPCHVPTQRLLFAKPNLKLLTCLPVASFPSSSAPPQRPLPSPAPAPTSGRRAAANDASLATGSLDSSSALSGLNVVVALAAPPPGNFDLDDKYHWDNSDLGVEYDAPPKVNMRVAPYSPLCPHVSVVSSVSKSALSSRLQTRQPCLSSALQQLLKNLCLLPVVLPLHHGRLAVTDTGATDHMVPDKSCFISYTLISGLSVQMGNNSYVLVLGHGTAIFALNGKRILVHNILHVLGLAVPLYSLCTHITQQSCGFIGTHELGFLVYYPTFILSINTAIDCHLSFDPLGWCALLATLHCIQPRCPPLYIPQRFLHLCLPWLLLQHLQ
jgi:hypothetical protein